MAGASLIDGTGGPPVEAARLVTEGGLVSCVGGPEDCPTPPGADVLDAEGFWIVPGLIDVNIGPDDAPGTLERSRLRFLLGVTTAGEPAHAGPADLLVRSERGRAVPSRVLSALSTGGSVLLEEIPEPGDSLAARLAAELSERGVALEPRLLGRELDAAPYRLPVGLNPLLELPLFTESIRTPVPERDPEEQAAVERRLERARDFVRDFHAAGGSVVTGSGGVIAPGLAIHEEMRALVDAGLAPEDALRAATREAAVALGVDDRGTLEPGKL
ncbi:MAG: hypothetical protein R3266_05350, partial [Gemmatimonadota bacterium]|nr:hypothetical protein [Gemmatimonadota bacterium]